MYIIDLFDDNFYNLDDYENEIWIPMEEFGNEFYVSNYGRIKRVERKWYSGRKNTTIKIIPESIVKQRVVPNGYIKATICYNSVKKSYSVHRLVAIHFIPNPNNYPEVNHKDGNKVNNSVYNLEWVTKSENQLHSVHVLNHKKGSYPKNLGKETADKIREYKKNNPNSSYNQISKIFNCSPNQAYNAIKKNSYCN